jgi:hypothetical protein
MGPKRIKPDEVTLSDAPPGWRQASIPVKKK